MSTTATPLINAPIAVAPVKLSSDRPAKCPSDEPLYEIVNGVKVELPPMSIFANSIAGMLFEILAPFARKNGLGRVNMEGLFILDPDANTRRRPDVAFVSYERWPQKPGLPRAGDWAVVPDLSIEVISPNDLHSEVQKKVAEYFQVRVRQIWLVLPEIARIHVYDAPTAPIRVFGRSDEMDCGPLLPGLRVKLAELFDLAGENPIAQV